MTDAASAPDLAALQDSYEINGELRDSETARKYIARRRADGVDVVITVFSPPKGGHNNELSHFAADVKLLSGLRGPGVARVFDARWLGTNILAVASERVPGTTLDEAIERGERFTNPRIATILREVNAALDWARTHGVVHRGVTPDTLYFEPRTDRAIVALAPTPIPITGVPDARGDAQTLGTLAWTMLAGRLPADPVEADDGEPQQPPTLTELAPNLAARVVDATEKMMRATTVEDAPDVATFIGIVAAGDVLKQAEVEIAATREEYQEQHRLEIARYVEQRRELEAQAAEQAVVVAEERAALAQQMTEQAEAMAEQRADFERTMAERREQLNAARDQLTAQAAELERRLLAFDERRREFDAFRDEQVREMAEARAMDSEFEADEFVLAPDDTGESPKGDEIGSILSSYDAVAAPSRGAAEVPGAPGAHWKIGASVGAGALILAVLIAGARQDNRRNSHAQAALGSVTVDSTTLRPTAPTLSNGNLPRAGFLSQRSASGGGNSSSGAPFVGSGGVRSAVVQPAAIVDSAGGNVAAVRPEAARPDSVRRDSTPRVPRPANDVNGMVPASVFGLPRRDTVTRRDTLTLRDTETARDPETTRATSTRAGALTRPDTLTARDTMRPSVRTTPRPARDSVARRDSARSRSAARLDSIFRAMTRPRPDTTTIRPRG